MKLLGYLIMLVSFIILAFAESRGQVYLSAAVFFVGALLSITVKTKTGPEQTK